MLDEVTPDCKGFETYFYSYFIFLGLLVILSGSIYVKTADLLGYFCPKRSTSLFFGQFCSSNIFFGAKLYFSSFGPYSFRCPAFKMLPLGVDILAVWLWKVLPSTIYIEFQLIRFNFYSSSIIWGHIYFLDGRLSKSSPYCFVENCFIDHDLSKLFEPNCISWSHFSHQFIGANIFFRRPIHSMGVSIYEDVCDYRSTTFFRGLVKL